VSSAQGYAEVPICRGWCHLEEAARLGISKLPSRRYHSAELEDRRPSFTEAFGALYGDSALDELGGILAGLFSATAHGTLFGLLQGFDRDAATPDP
jgi:hypothetical protein